MATIAIDEIEESPLQFDKLRIIKCIQSTIRTIQFNIFMRKHETRSVDDEMQIERNGVHSAKLLMNNDIDRRILQNEKKKNCKIVSFCQLQK